MKNVLLLAHDDSGQEARLQAALDLTRALSGHLHCLDVTPPPLMADPLWATGAGTIVYDEADRETENFARLEQRLAGEDVAWSGEHLRGDFASCLGAAIRTADVVVLNRGDAPFPHPNMGTIAGQLLTEGETLVLAVPEGLRTFGVAGPAMIAWDGSETAMHAVQRAVPLLALACSVTVFQAGVLPGEAISIRDVAAYLARHEIKPEIEVSEDSEAPAAQIAQRAESLEIAYCVMGAYGHSRLREALFGGVTREMLSSSGLPLLLGH